MRAELPLANGATTTRRRIDRWASCSSLSRIQPGSSIKSDRSRAHIRGGAASTGDAAAVFAVHVDARVHDGTSWSESTVCRMRTRYCSHARTLDRGPRGKASHPLCSRLFTKWMEIVEADVPLPNHPVCGDVVNDWRPSLTPGRERAGYARSDERPATSQGCSHYRFARQALTAEAAVGRAARRYGRSYERPEDQARERHEEQRAHRRSHRPTAVVAVRSRRRLWRVGRRAVRRLRRGASRTATLLGSSQRNISRGPCEAAMSRHRTKIA